MKSVNFWQLPYLDLSQYTRDFNLESLVYWLKSKYGSCQKFPDFMRELQNSLLMISRVMKLLCDECVQFPTPFPSRALTVLPNVENVFPSRYWLNMFSLEPRGQCMAPSRALIVLPNLKMLSLAPRGPIHGPFRTCRCTLAATFQYVERQWLLKPLYALWLQKFDMAKTITMCI